MFQNKLCFIKSLIGKFFQILSLIWINVCLVIASIDNSFLEEDVNAATPQFRQFTTYESEDIGKESDLYEEVDLNRMIQKVPLEWKYQRLAGIHYAPNIQPYLPIIDKVLSEKGLDENALFIQAMFYVGQHESHWRVRAISSVNIKGGHPTGIFQFLPGTFSSVSNGDIFNVEDQVRAFIVMVERGRADEFGVLFICSYLPCLSREERGYVLNYREK